MKQSFVSRLVAVFAAIAVVLAAAPAPSFAGPDIDMACSSSALLPALKANDETGQTWHNPCGTPAYFSVVFVQGLWNYGSIPPFNSLVRATGNPDGPVKSSFANPGCRGAELSYIINGQHVDAPHNCYHLNPGTLVPTNGTLTLIDNDQLGKAYLDNCGFQLVYVQNTRLSPGVRTLEDLVE